MGESLKELLLSGNEAEVKEGVGRLNRENFFQNLPTVIELIRKNKGAAGRTAARTASKILEEMLSDKAGSMAAHVRALLSRFLLELAPDILPRITREFRMGDLHRRLDSLYLLRSINDGKAAAQILNAALDDNNKLIRSTAVKVLGRIANSREPGIIAKFMRDTDSRVRANAVEALEETANRNITGMLVKFRRDANNRVRGNVLKALWTAGFTDILEDLKEMLKTENELMRSSAVWVIGEVGRESKEVAALLDLVKADTAQLVRTNYLLAQDKISRKKAAPLLPDKPARKGLKSEKNLRDRILKESGVTIQEKATRYFNVLSVDGPLNVYSMIPLKLRAEKLIEKNSVNIALDFGKVTDVDGPVISFLANLNRKIRNAGGKFMIFNVSYDIMVVFNFANLDSSVLVFTGDEKVDHLL